jgi:hypothetical protein
VKDAFNRPHEIPASKHKKDQKKLLQPWILKDFKNPEIVSDQRQRYGKNEDQAKANE